MPEPPYPDEIGLPPSKKDMLFEELPAIWQQKIQSYIDAHPGATPDSP